MFDPETGAFAANMAMRKLAESGQVGYSEIGKVLTYDGNIEGKETAVYEGLTFVKISDTVYDVTDVQSLKFVQADGSVFEAGKELFIIGALGNIKAIMACVLQFPITRKGSMLRAASHVILKTESVIW